MHNFLSMHQSAFGIPDLPSQRLEKRGQLETIAKYRPMSATRTREPLKSDLNYRSLNMQRVPLITSELHKWEKTKIDWHKLRGSAASGRYPAKWSSEYSESSYRSEASNHISSKFRIPQSAV